MLPGLVLPARRKRVATAFGRRIAIGEVELTISEPCRRCAFTIIAQDGFDYDAEILRTLVRNNGHNIGVYCTVDRPGRIETGAEMRFL